MNSIILTIAGSLIVILLSIIGYFIVKDKKAQEDTNAKLFDYLDKQRESTEKLNISITSLNAVLLVIQEKHDGLEKRFDEHKDTCREKFKSLISE
jgi:hypothetical protein